MTSDRAHTGQTQQTIAASGKPIKANDPGVRPVAARDGGTPMHYLKLLSETDDHAIIGGYGVIFGGRDLTGETFTAQTDFDLPRVKGAPAFVDHTLDDVIEMEGRAYNVSGIKARVGEIIDVSPDDIGLWMRLKIEKANQYWRHVEEMLQRKVGLSTGTVGHLAMKSAGGVIERWPIAEVSITMTPAEPRTVEHLQRIKSDLSVGGEGKPESKPESDGQSLVRANADPVTAVLKNDNGNEVKTMSEEKQEVKAPAVDFTPILEAIGGLKSLVDAQNKEIEALKSEPVNPMPAGKPKAPAVLKHGVGDNEGTAFKAFVAGDNGREFEVKASNATDMNIGTAADGGNLVPTGFYNQIIARRDETSLKAQLPLMRVPGVGTTVDVPLDNEADGEFVSTNEAATFDLDAPAVSKKSLTLVKYTKYVDVSYELMEDTPTNLMNFLSDFVGRGLAKTDNNLLLTEVAANGTSLKTFANAASIVFGEPEDIVGNNDLGAYLEDDAGVAWVMRNATLWDIKSIVGNDRQYSINVDGANRSLLGYPVRISQKAAAIGGGNRSMYFGNWRYVAYREAPSLTFIRDPYTVAVSGQVRLLWHYRTVFGVLQSEAIGYGIHPTA